MISSSALCALPSMRATAIINFGSPPQIASATDHLPFRAKLDLPSTLRLGIRPHFELHFGRHQNKTTGAGDASLFAIDEQP